MQRYRNWHKTLSKQNQRVVSLGLQWLYWFTIWFVAQRYIAGEERSFNYHLFSATCMAIFMTIFLQWPVTKALFTRKRRANKL